MTLTNKDKIEMLDKWIAELELAAGKEEFRQQCQDLTDLVQPVEEKVNTLKRLRSELWE